MATFSINAVDSRVQYTGDGTTTDFAFTFQVNSSSELAIYSDDTLKTITTHYTVSLNSDGTGTVAYGSAPGSGVVVTIMRNMALSRSSNFVAGGTFSASDLETPLDNSVLLDQQLQEQTDRSLQLKPTTKRTVTGAAFGITGPLYFPYDSTVANNANKAIVFDNDGTALTTADKVTSGGDSTKFTYSTTTTDADPGSGYVRFNNSTLASATIAYIDDADAFANDVTNWVQSFDDVSGNSTSRGRIRMYKANNIGIFAVYKINAAITDASGYTKVPLTYIAGAGSFSNDDEVFISFVAHGEDGTSAGLDYLFSSTTTDSDPGSGYVRLNNGTYSSATAIYIDDADSKGVDVSADVLTWDDSTSTVKGFVTIKDQTTQSSYARFSISGTTTDASGYNKLAVTHIDSNGTITNGGAVSIHFTRTGDKGTKGAVTSYNYNFDTSTSDADPGSGDIRFNHGTYSSVTAIYIDDAEANGVDVSADVLTWDDSTSTIKGYLHIVDTDDSTTWARFSITGATTDASGYNKLSVTHLSSNNTFSAADSLSVHFSPYGLKGDTGATGSTAGTSGLGMTWDNSTADADNGAGKIAWNHATIASATVLYVDDVDDAGATIEPFVKTWDDVSNSTSRGYVQITKEGETGTYAVFKVNAAVTNATGYTKVNVAHVVSAGSFSDGDGVGVQFVQSGNDGSGAMDNWTLSDGSATQQVDDGETLVVAAGEGIDTAVTSTNTVTISGEDSAAANKGVVIVAGTTPISIAYSSGTATVSASDASTSAKGIASFLAQEFTVASGAVSFNDSMHPTITSTGKALVLGF